jgi:CDP-glucose 4,6-dehydratase
MNSFWRDRSVFVTGGTGLLGSWLVSQLIEADARIVCLVRDWVPQSEGVHNLRIEQVSTVRGDTTDRNLLEACRRSRKVASIVVASSDKAYGDQEHLPYTKKMPLARPSSLRCQRVLRGHDRADLHCQLQPAGRDHALRKLRGGGDLNWNRVVPGTIRSVIHGERPIIRSDGKFVRDYIYIEDAAAAYMLLAERLASDAALHGQAFNFSYEIQVSVLGTPCGGPQDSTSRHRIDTSSPRDGGRIGAQTKLGLSYERTYSQSWPILCRRNLRSRGLC